MDDKLVFLRKMSAEIRAILMTSPGPLASQLQNSLSRMEQTLDGVIMQVTTIENERQSLLGLADTTRAVNSSLELDEVLCLVMDTIVHLTRAERGFLMLRDDQGEMIMRLARNWEQESINPEEFAISRTVIQRVIDSCQPVLTTNALEDPRFEGQESVVTHNLRAILCVPLKIKDDLIGVIYADNRIRSGIFTVTERDLLVIFANQAAIAIEHARLFASVHRALDEVTGLKNLLNNILSSIASGVITINELNQITHCNQAAETILATTREELLGRRVEEAMPLLAKELHPHITKVRTSDIPVYDLEISHSLPMTGDRQWRLNLSPLMEAGQSTKGVAIVLEDLTERKHLEAQRRLLGRMLSPTVIDQVDPDNLQPGGLRSEVTILFADLRGFTRYAQTQTPEHLVMVLNRYLSIGVEAVMTHNGTVDKFLGDGIMAWFNAPVLQADHTLRAVRTALDLKKAVQSLHADLPMEARLTYSVGIHTGEAVLGWIGTQKRLEFTAIGDSVNIARRIQESASPGQILVTRAACDRIRGVVELSPITPMNVKGKTEPLEVWEVVGLK